jgi:hypothetical protein
VNGRNAGIRQRLEGGMFVRQKSVDRGAMIICNGFEQRVHAASVITRPKQIERGEAKNKQYFEPICASTL